MTHRSRVLLDKFRGRSTAMDAAAAIAAGLHRAGFDEVRSVPLADGGEGTLDAFLAAQGGPPPGARVTGPLGDPVDAEYGLTADGLAIVEMAQASGLALVRPQERPAARVDPRHRRAPRRVARGGAKRALVGVGGSATTDGGLAALEALGWSLRWPRRHRRVRRHDVASSTRRRIYGPQKGATAAQVELLRRRLAQLVADRVRTAHRGRRDHPRRRGRGRRPRRRPGGDRRPARARLRRRSRPKPGSRSALDGADPRRHRRRAPRRDEPRGEGGRRRARVGR